VQQQQPNSPAKRRSPAALAVGLGILLSRIAGFVRDRVFAHYLGNSDAAGAFRAALRIPNLLQNLFGEGVLSASFIPVYARLRAEGKEEQAFKMAGVIASLLALLMALLATAGVLLSRPLIEILAPGFSGEVREVTINMVQIMFPGTALLVLSAWSLGILNSHRRFFLSYVAPVLWNVAIITTLVVFGGREMSSQLEQMRLVELVAWGTVAGAALQFFVQLPMALSLNKGLKLSLNLASPAVRSVIKNFFPALLTRGVVQLSAYIDQVLASFLGPGAVAAMAYSQTISLLPVSLFGMSVSTAELPEMSSAIGTDEEIANILRVRLENGLKRISFYIIPSAAAFLVLGDVVVGTIFQTGKFGAEDTFFVWLILIGSTIGLVASTQSRLCVSVFWALRDTKTPSKFAFLRVFLTAAFGYLVTFPLRTCFQWPVVYSAAGLTASAGLAGWLEFLLIRKALTHRIGPFSLGGSAIPKTWMAALAASGLGYGVKLCLPLTHPFMTGALILGVYSISYLCAAWILGLEEVKLAVKILKRVVGRKP
jgi:putative peptidoglycan lipid II flippase